MTLTPTAAYFAFIDGEISSDVDNTLHGADCVENWAEAIDGPVVCPCGRFVANGRGVDWNHELFPVNCSIFASTPPLNDDPMPMVGIASGQRYATPFNATDAREPALHRPRREYERPRAHPGNRILTAFRDDPFYSDLRKRATSYLDVNLHDMSQDADFWEWTPAEIKHATKVLARLAAS